MIPFAVTGNFLSNLMPKSLKDFFILSLISAIFVLGIKSCIDTRNIDKIKKEAVRTEEISKGLEIQKKAVFDLYFSDKKALSHLIKKDSLVMEQLAKLKIPEKRVERFYYNTSNTLISIVGQQFTRSQNTDSSKTYSTTLKTPYYDFKQDIKIFCDSCEIKKVVADLTEIKTRDTLFMLTYEGRRAKIKWLLGLRLGKRELKDTSYNKSPNTSLLIKRQYVHYKK